MPKDCYVVQPLKVWSKKKCFSHIIPEKSGLTQSLEEINLSKVFFSGSEQATRACQIFSNKILEMMIKPNNWSPYWYIITISRVIY